MLVLLCAAERSLMCTRSQILRDESGPQYLELISFCVTDHRMASISHGKLTWKHYKQFEGQHFCSLLEGRH